MHDLAEALQRIDARLASIEAIVSRRPVTEVVCKEAYSCSQVAALTSEFGITKYRPFTVRLACGDGRIPEAEKLDNGQWRVPRSAVLRILAEGIPPERR